ncbi:MAG TPA: LacI family DNA-binding transcriptional regulator [Fimbriimonadaceae bacterium]|jgi:DNA-binding LacI/PurR family transcriptional regulator
MESYGRKKSTISQVAYRAGVSVTTVSLYLAGNTKVCSAETGKRIDRAVQELNYQPNPLAGSSWNKDRHTIGLLASDDLERGNKPWVVHNMRFVSGIFEIANENNYAVLAYPFRVYLERQYRAVLDGRVDGILFYGSGNHEIVKKLTAANMPVVCFGLPEPATGLAGVVHTDERAITTLAIEHLWKLGHRRIAHLAGPFEDCFRYLPGVNSNVTKIPEPAEKVSEARRNAAMEILIKHHAYDPELFSVAHSWHDPDVTPSMEHWWEMEQRPTAIYCANDFIAWKAIDWARSRRIRIPEDLAIIGVDNVESPNQERFLSSIEVPVEEIGRQAMRLILDVLSGACETESVRMIEPAFLEARASTVPPKKDRARKPKPLSASES